MSSSSSSPPVVVSFASSDGDFSYTVADCRAGYRQPLLSPLLISTMHYGRAVVDACTGWLLRADERSTRLYATFVDQIVRSSTSMAKNLADGHGQATLRQRIKNYSIARGSLLETMTFLRFMDGTVFDASFRARLDSIDETLKAEATTACKEMLARYSQTRRVEDRKTVDVAQEHLAELERPLPTIHAEAVALALSVLHVIEEWSSAQQYFAFHDPRFERVQMPLLVELVKSVTATAAHIAEGHGSFSLRRNFQFIRLARATVLTTLVLLQQLPAPFATSLADSARRLAENITEEAARMCVVLGASTFSSR